MPRRLLNHRRASSRKTTIIGRGSADCSRQPVSTHLQKKCAASFGPRDRKKTVYNP